MDSVRYCPCCKKEYNRDRRASKLPCDHYFCASCILKKMRIGRIIKCLFCQGGKPIRNSREVPQPPQPLVNEAQNRHLRLKRLMREKEQFLWNIRQSCAALVRSIDIELAKMANAPMVPKIPFENLETCVESLRKQSAIMKLSTNHHCAPEDFHQISTWSEAERAEATIHGTSEDFRLLQNFCLYQKQLLKPTLNGPKYYFRFKVKEEVLGRVVVQTCLDVAPRMCQRFHQLIMNKDPPKYQGCSLTRLFPNESITFGDCATDSHNEYFEPDESRLRAMRGAIGFRRRPLQRDVRCDVGYELRMLLVEISNISAIFGFITEGMDVVEEISRCSRAKDISVAWCGQLLQGEIV